MRADRQAGCGGRTTIELLDDHSIVYTLAGLGAIGGALLPRLIRQAPASPPMLFLAFGAVGVLLPLPEFSVSPLQRSTATEYLTEIGVLVALMGAGLKLDRPLGWSTWSATWRLLAITMPLTIVGTALLGWWAVGLAPASAVLLGAVLAPTDPVLASDVQVGPPGEEEGEEDDLRFSLTSEAGLNDALAFPFTNAAIAMALNGSAPGNWLLEWVAVDVAYKLVVGLVAGLLVGRVLAWMTFSFPEPARLAHQGEGFVALAGTFLAYGVTEAAGGYGFLAVFVAAVSLRRYESGHDYHDTLHDFAEQSERLLTIGIVALLGAAIAEGLLEALTVPAALTAVALVVVIRPLAGWIALSRHEMRSGERAAVSFLGIRGVGSLYYMAYAANKADFEDVELLWATVAAAVLLSIVLHGTTSTAITRRLDRGRELRRHREGDLTG